MKFKIKSKILKSRIIISMFLIAVLFGCDDGLSPDYMAQQPKVLAVRIENPEVTWGQTVRMNLLVGGSTVNQNMTNPVSWLVDLSQPDQSGISVPYNQVFVFDSTYWDAIPSEVVPAQYQEQGWFDFPIIARIVVNGKILNVKKVLRITKTPAHPNPTIIGVDVVYRTGSELHTHQIRQNGERLDIDDPLTNNVALTAVVDETDLTPDNLFVYRWNTSFSKTTSNRLYINDEQTDIDDLLGPGADADESKQSAIFSLKGETRDEGFQAGEYDIYIVVKDKARNSQSRATDRLGMDYFYFTLCIGCLQ